MARAEELCHGAAVIATTDGRRGNLRKHRAPWLVVGSAAVLVAVHNILVARGISEVGTVLANMGFAGVMLVVAHRDEIDQIDVGTRVTRRGVAIAAAAAALCALLVAAWATLGTVPTDRTVASLTPGASWFRVLVAIPIGTALCEEVIFRGVILAGFDRVTTPLRSTIATSALFGLWHVAAEANRVGRLDLTVVPGVIATAVASAFVLCPLRRWAGDLAAPVAVHAVVNAGVFTAVALTAHSLS